MANHDDYREEWEIAADLGAGGQATTSHVKSKIDGRLGVLKLLRNNKSSQARRRMYQEVANLRIVADAGGCVPRVLDDNVGQFENKSAKLYFVMEHVQGPTLDEYVKQYKCLSLDPAVRIVLDICKTVAIGHAQNVLHRDLKPKNIIVISSELEKTSILDYGLSFNSSGELDGITETNEHFRNEFFSLPEATVGGGDRRDSRSDYTAICGLLYFCLTGHYPELLRDSAETPPHKRNGRSIREALGEHPMISHLDAFFHTGFAANIADRFQNLNDVTGRLHAILSSAASPPPDDPIIVAARASERLRRTNRSIQLGEYGKAITPVLNAVNIHVIENFVGQLGLFQIQQSNTGMLSQLQLPQNIEAVGSALCFMVRAEHCKKQELIAYKVGAAENEAVIFQAIVPMSNLTSGMFVAQKPFEARWREVFRYPGDSPPDKQLIIDDLKRSLNELMEKYV